MRDEKEFKVYAELLVRYFKNELNASEMKDFELWRSSDPQNEVLLESFRDTKTVQAEINYIDQVDVAGGFDAVLKQIGSNKPVRRILPAKWAWYSSAAVVLIALSFGAYKLIPVNTSASTSLAKVKYDIMPGTEKALLLMADGSKVDLNKSNKQLTQKDGAVIGTRDGRLVYKSTKGTKTAGYNTLRTPKAGEYRLVLDDGTRVWLNASSSLRFPATFNKTERRVFLVGEAYFEVAHNKAAPFIVSFNDTEVKVLGTHFNINTYGKASKTTLIEGAIAVTEGNQEKFLKPGDEAIITTGNVAVAPTETYKSIAWKEGVFYFNGDQMADILDQVARWYDVKIVYKGNPGDKKYNGNIRRQATLSQVLEMLNAVSGADFTLQDRTVIVNFNTHS